MTEVDRSPGEQLGRYRLVRAIGRGGMAAVWQAHDVELGRDVALKLLPVLSQTADARLRREAKAMARLDHPNVLAIHDIGEVDGTAFIATELMRGTLREWLAERPRTRREIIDALVAAARGLAAAHRAGIVHRDIKPENLLVAPGKAVKVSDFGIAGETLTSISLDTPVDPLASLSTDEGVAGTPAYMAPEQILGKPCDARADQFSFCVTAWEALTGSRPFAKATGSVPTLAGHLAAVTRGSLERGARPLARAIERVLRRGLAVDPAERFETLDAFAEAFARSAARPVRRIAAAALLFVALVSVGAWLALRDTTPKREVWREHPLGHAHDDSGIPLVELADDASHLVVAREGLRTLQVVGLDGVQRGSIPLPERLVVEATAVGPRGDIAIAGTRDGRFEVWCARAGGAFVKFGELEASGTLHEVVAMERPATIAIVGENVIVTRVAPEVWRLDGKTPPVVIARVNTAERVRTRPGTDTFAVLDWLNDKFVLHVMTLDGRILVTVSDLPTWSVNFDWVDHDRFIVGSTAGQSTKLTEFTLAADGTLRSQRWLRDIDGSMWSISAAPGSIVVVRMERGFGMYMTPVSTGELQPINDGGWTGNVAGWIDNDTLLLDGQMLGRTGLVALSRTAPPRVLIQDVEGDAVWMRGDRIVVASDYETSFCGVRAYVRGVVERTVEVPCGGDPKVACSSLTGTCMIAAIEDHHRVYRSLDPATLTFGAVLFRDPEQADGMSFIAGISADGLHIAIPRPARGLTVVDVQRQTTTEIADVTTGAQRAWMTATFAEATGRMLVCAVDKKMRGYVLDVGLDGSIRTVVESQRGFFQTTSPSPDGLRIGLTRNSITSRPMLIQPDR